MPTTKDLPTYQQLIESLADRLEGLSTVNSSLGDAAKSLVAAHRELAEAKVALDAFAVLGNAVFDEVRQLQPAELAGRIETGFSRLELDTSRSFSTLSERLEGIDAGVRTALEKSDAHYRLLDTLLSEHKTLPGQLSGLQHALESKTLSVGQELGASLTANHFSMVELVGDVQTRLGTLGESSANIRHQCDAITQQLALTAAHLGQLKQHQAELGQNHDRLSRQLSDLNQNQENLRLQVEAVTQAVEEIREILISVKDISLDTHVVTREVGPLVVSAITNIHKDLSAGVSRLLRFQLSWVLVILITLAVAWAAIR